MSVTVEFMHGPLDGEVRALPTKQREITVVIPESPRVLAQKSEATTPDADVAFKHAVYVLDPWPCRIDGSLWRARYRKEPA